MPTKLFSPKKEIINYFDELINQVDIDIEESIKNYNENQVLGDLKWLKYSQQEFRFNNYLKIFESTENNKNEYRTVELWPESTKVVDYLNQVRMRTIEELRKAQEESLEYYKLNSSRFKYLKEINDDEKIKQFKSEFFREKFYFQVRITRKNQPWFFNQLTFVTDFYMSPSDIKLLEMFITNSLFYEVLKFLVKSLPVFDEKMVLIDLLLANFYDHLTTQKYPNNVISVSNRDILNIKEIKCTFPLKRLKLTSCSSIDLSKLERLTLSNIGDSEEIKLDGLSSLKYLHLKLRSAKRFSARKLTSLTHLVIESEKLNKSLSTEIFENLPNINELEINGVFSDISLDNLINLEKLTLSGSIGKNVNFDLFKNICNHLQELFIKIGNIDEEKLNKLFQSHKFPYLVNLSIKCSDITKLEKRMFEGFPMLQSLTINENSKLREIDNDAFSNLTNLFHLALNGNCIKTINQRHLSALINLESLALIDNQIERIEENAFSNLKNLKSLNLLKNRLVNLSPNLFISLKKLKHLDLRHNKLVYFHLRIFDYIVNFESIYIYHNNFINLDEILKFDKVNNESLINPELY